MVEMEVRKPWIFPHVHEANQYNNHYYKWCYPSKHSTKIYSSTAGRYRPVRVADGPTTARCRFIKNASWDVRFNADNNCNLSIIKGS